MLNLKSAARLAATVGICASMAIGPMPAVAIADDLADETTPVETSGPAGPSNPVDPSDPADGTTDLSSGTDSAPVTTSAPSLGTTAPAPAAAEMTAEQFKAAIEAGGTVTLESNVTLPQNFEIVVPEGVSTVLDLNGWTVTKTKASSNEYTIVIGGGSLTVNDSKDGGKIVAPQRFGYGFELQGNGSKLIINGGEITTNDEVISVDYFASDATIEVSGGILTATNDSAVSIGGGTNVSVSVTGGTFKSDGTTFYLNPASHNPGELTFNMTDGEVVSDRWCFQVRSGSAVTIDGGTFTKNDNGAGYFMQIEDESKTVINRGQFNLNGCVSIIRGYDDESCTATCVINGGDFKVDSGSFSGAAFDPDPKGSSHITVAGGSFALSKGGVVDKDAAAGSVTIAGGSFTSANKPAEIEDQWIAPGFSVDKETGKVEQAADAKVAVVRNGVTIGVFDTLAAALEAGTATAGDTIKLGEGTYDAFTAPAGVTLEGAGVGKTVIKNSNAAKFTLGGADIMLKNLTIDSTADGNAVTGDAANLVIDGVEFLGNGKADSTALYIHERNIEIKNSTFKDFNRGYYTCGDNHAAGVMTFTGNTFTNVQAPIDGYWGKPADGTTNITVTGNTFDGGTWGKAFVQLWDYAQYQYWFSGDQSTLNPEGKSAINATVTGNTGDFDLVLTHGNWYSNSALTTDHEVVNRALIEIDGDDVESVTVKNADGTPVTNWNEHPQSQNRNGKVVIYTMSEGDYIFEVTHKAAEGGDPIVTEQKVTVVAPKVGDDTPVVKVTPLTEEQRVVATVGDQEYTSLQKAIEDAAKSGGTVEVLQNVSVKKWSQVTWNELTNYRGLTINGNGHSLTVEECNGGFLLYDGRDLHVNDMTFNVPENISPIRIESGSVSGVTVNGGNMGVQVAYGDVEVSGCTFNGTKDWAVYSEGPTEGKLTVRDSTFNVAKALNVQQKPALAEGNVFNSSVVAIAPDNAAKLTGNTFAGESTIELWDSLDEGEFTGNSISPESRIVLGNPELAGPGKLDLNYWGSADGPAAGQLPEGAKVDAWYEDEDMTRLNTDPETFKVTFVFGNGQEDEVFEVEEGKTVDKPADPKREGYVFDGWLAADGSAYDFTAPVTGDITLTASWKPESTPDPEPAQTVTVTFMYGDKVYFQAEVEAGSTLTGASLPDDPTWDGHVFSGWYAKVNADGTVDESTKVELEGHVFSADTTLHAGFVTEGEPEDKPSVLPQAGDVTAVAPLLMSAAAGVTAVAAGAVALRRRDK